MKELFYVLPVIESDEVMLKQIDESDLDELFSIYNNTKVFEFCGILPKHKKETVRKMIGHFQRDFNKKSRMKLGIYLKSSSKLVGIIECMDYKKKVQMITIGYYLAEEHWGKGIATKALSILTNYVFNETNIQRIQAEVMVENIVSKRVLLKNSYVLEGTIRQGGFWPSKGVIDYELYSILKKEYET